MDFLHEILKKFTSIFRFEVGWLDQRFCWWSFTPDQCGEDMDVSENSGTPKSSILIGFSIINHIFWGTPIFGNTHVFLFFSIFDLTYFSMGGPKKHAMLSSLWFEFKQLVKVPSSFNIFNMKIEVGNRSIYKLNYDVFPTNPWVSLLLAN